MVSTLTFEMGSNQTCASIIVFDDLRVEDEESFMVSLSPIDIAIQKMRLMNSTATIVIIDNDSESQGNLI